MPAAAVAAAFALHGIRDWGSGGLSLYLIPIPIFRYRFSLTSCCVGQEALGFVEYIRQIVAVLRVAARNRTFISL